MFSLPFPGHQLPTDAKVFRSQLIQEVKRTNIPGIFELKIRDVIIGTKQEKYVDFEGKYAPTFDGCV